ncbi:MAG: MBOAT family protein [Betaproteobacteria bacterium]|nr:MBOAT family protein [Betaproteobacteria bacterium]
MLFNSYVFIFVFLPAVLAVYALVRRHPPWTIAWLVLASLFYYAWWKPQFLILLLVSISVNALFGKALCSGGLSRPVSRAVLTAGIVFNLGLLGYFKYAGFFVENLNTWFGAGLIVPQIILPIGISFITFQKIAFLVDAHKGAVRNFSLQNYALFVTFFPQLIAGPIVHHAEMIPQFVNRRADDPLASDLAVGLSIFIVGLFKKVVVADTCAIYADAGYATIKAGHALDPASAWIVVLAYSFQLYYDFSGYSDMAVGLGRIFGIRLPVNFHSPYKASGVIDFWRRWHMTLSRFLRDYLYIPLGGNRHGAPRRYLSLGAVMLLGGLWHGANWTFVLWGALHGALLAVNHAWTRLRAYMNLGLEAGPARTAGILLTFIAVTLAWVPFRAESLDDAGRMLAALFPAGPDAPAIWASFRNCLRAQFTDPATWFRARELWPVVLPPDFLATYRPGGLVLAIIAAATFLMPNSNQLFAKFDPVLGLSAAQLRTRASLKQLDWKAAFVLSGMFVFSVLQLSRVSPFLYFQF